QKRALAARNWGRLETVRGRTGEPLRASARLGPGGSRNDAIAHAVDSPARHGRHRNHRPTGEHGGGCMDRKAVEDYFKKNPPSNRVDVKELLDRCERAVERHAREDAWLAAKAYALERARKWQSEWSQPASERFVTNEV